MEIQKRHCALQCTNPYAGMCCNPNGHCQVDLATAQASRNIGWPTKPQQSQARQHRQPPPCRKETLRQTGWQPTPRLTVQKCYIFNFRDWITPQCRKIKNLTFAKPPVWAPQWLSGCGALGSVRSVVSTGGGLSMASCWGFLARCWLLALVCCLAWLPTPIQCMCASGAVDRLADRDHGRRRRKGH